MPFDILSARDEGYSDDDIKKSLSDSFDVDGAIDEGYTLDEIAEAYEPTGTLKPTTPESVAIAPPEVPPPSTSPKEALIQPKFIPPGGPGGMPPVAAQALGKGAGTLGKSLAVGVASTVSNLLRQVGTGARAKRVVSPKAREEPLGVGEFQALGMPVKQPAAWEELDIAEKTAKMDPTILEKAAKAIDKWVPEKWKKEVAEKSDISFDDPTKVPQAVLNNAAQQLPLLATQMGLSLVATPAAGVGSMMLLEGGGFNQSGQQMIDAMKEKGASKEELLDFQHNLEKNSWLYGALSGTTEFAGNALGPLRGLIGKKGAANVAGPAIKKVLKELGGFVGEGAEEMAQGGLMNFFMHKAIEDTRKEHSEFAPEWKPESLWKNFITGALVSPVLRGGVKGVQAIKETKVAKPTETIESESAEISEEIVKGPPRVSEKKKDPIEEIVFTEEMEAEVTNTLKNSFIEIGLTENEATKNATGFLDKITPAEKQMQHNLITKGERDNLTGLLTRVGLENKGYIEIKDGKKGLVATETVVIDIDKFKSFNDMHGHEAGDEVLHTAGIILEDNLKGKALVSRFGGEEFVILNSNKSEKLNDEQKGVILESLENARKELKEIEFDFGGEKVQGVNFSAGFGENFKMADEQVFLAKEKGRGHTRIEGEIYGEVKIQGAGAGISKASSKDISKKLITQKKQEKEPKVERPTDPIAQLPQEAPAKPRNIPESKEPPAPESIGLNKQEIRRVRATAGLSQLSPEEAKKTITSLNNAKAKKIDFKAVSIADEILISKRAVTDEEHAGMVLKAGELLNQSNEITKTIAELHEKGETANARFEIAKREQIMDDIDRLTRASDQAGRETARALNIRKMMVTNQTYDLASVVRDARVVKGRKLTTKENAKFEKLTGDYNSLQKNYEALNVKFEATQIEKEKLLAKNIAKTLSTMARKKKTNFDKIYTERADIEKQLTSIGYRLNDITGLTSEGAYLIGRLAMNYIDEAVATTKGKVDMAEVVKRLKEKVPDLTSQDAYRALISRDPKRQAKARSEASKQKMRLKTQARLLAEIDDASKGIFAAKKAPPLIDKEIKDLQGKLKELRKGLYTSGIQAKQLERAVFTINELQDQLDNQHRAIREEPNKPATPPELTAAREKIKQLKRAINIDDAMSDIDEQLRTGEFKIPEPKTPKKVPFDLEKAELALKRRRKEIRLAISEMGPLTVGRVIDQVASLPRAMLSTGDFSGWLRQNVVQVFAHPIQSAKLIPSTTKAFFSEYNAEKIENEIKTSSNAYLYDKSKLILRELDSSPSRREESFRSNIIEKVPVLGWVARASNRHMASLGNLIRTSLFDDFLAKNPNATHEELSAYADILNVTTGIGSLGKFEQAAGTLSTLLFAPKLAVSRFQTPYLLVKYRHLPRVRKRYAKELASFVATGTTILGLVAMIADDDDDIEVGSDPRGANWGKIKVGNSRFDIWGGFQQPARLIARVGLGATDKMDFTGKNLPKEYRKADFVELVWRFSKYKMSPAISLASSLYTGKTIVGEKVTPAQAIAKSFVMLTLQDVHEAYRDAGLKRAVFAGGAAFIGIGVNTYKRGY